MAIGHFAGVDSGAIAMFRGVWSVEHLIPSILARMVVYSLCRRVPTAPASVRWIWAHGRMLLTAAASLDFVVVLIVSFQQREINDQSLPSILAAMMDLYILIYVSRARRVRDAFSEFPMAFDTPEVAEQD